MFIYILCRPQAISNASGNQMGQQSYTRLSRRWRRAKGFRLSCNRFAVFRPRLTRLFTFFGLLNPCLRLLKEGFRGNDPRRCDGSSSARGLVSEGRRGGQPEFKLRSCVRSNSFYAEAIADCLEFIKRSSVSVDDNSPAAGAGR